MGFERGNGGAAGRRRRGLARSANPRLAAGRPACEAKAQPSFDTTDARACRRRRTNRKARNLSFWFFPADSLALPPAGWGTLNILSPEFICPQNSYRRITVPVITNGIKKEVSKVGKRKLKPPPASTEMDAYNSNQ